MENHAIVAVDQTRTIMDPASQSRRAIDLVTAFQRTGQRELLDESIALFRAVLDATPVGRPGRAMCLSNLGCALQDLFRHTGHLAALEEAAAVGRQAVGTASVDHPSRAMFLSNLGGALQDLAGYTGQQAALEEAVAVGRQAVAAAPDDHPDRAMYLSNFGSALRTLFERTGDLAALEEAVAVGRRAVAAASEEHPSRSKYLNNLANALRDLFERTGQLAVLEEAADIGRQIVAATEIDHYYYATFLNNLGITLLALSGRTGQLSVLEEAVAVGRQAVDVTSDEHPDRAMYLSNLGIALHDVFESTGRLAVVLEAVAVGRQAVDAIAADDPDTAMRLSNLGISLRALFARSGQLAALEESVTVGRQAVDVTSEDHPDRAIYLNNLGSTLLMVFEHTGQLVVLEEAVAVGRQAVDATAADHPDRAMRLSNLGIALWALFGRTGQLETLAAAVAVGRQAVDATAEGHPDRAMYLSNLGNSLRGLFRKTSDLRALDEAVQVGRQAVDATPIGRSDRAGYLNNLGGSLRARFEHTGDLAALEEAVTSARQAADATPEDHPDRATVLGNLGDTLQELFERTEQLDVLIEARGHYREAASRTTGATIARIGAYRQLASSAGAVQDSQDGLRCVEAAIDLVETLAPGSLARADRAHQLGQLANLATEAAAAALNAGRPERAVELLERTRGILAADTLGLRSEEQARLRRHRPALADRLEQLRDRLAALDQPRSTALPDPGVSRTRTAQVVAATDRRLADERREAHAAWQALLQEIRADADFADFLRAPSADALAGYTRGGPVVYVIAGRARCDALILTDTPDPVQAVPLTGLTDDAVFDQTNRLLNACNTASTRDLPSHTDPDALPPGQQDVLDVLAWLWDTIAEPVLAQLGHAVTPAADQPWPRLWWCPVGVLAFLPLHAAGHYASQPGRPRQSGTSCTVPDLVVSSYTPTVRALAQVAHPGTTNPNALIVPVPDLPGAKLPGVVGETAAISTLIPDAHTLHRPTRAAVLAALPAHRIAHFACHGHADRDQPARSSLILTDHATDPLTVADITALNLHADLAYLSACDTTVTGLRMADESLHITGAFHLAGYRHVIGTLWSIDDAAAAQIAGDFYTHLTADASGPRPERSAHALHAATSRLRAKYPDSPALWAAHTHTGS
jgi:collagenase-like PrtC family protease